MGWGQALFAAGLAGVAATATQAQVRLNHADILGRWCGANTVWQVSRERLVIIRHGDRRRTTVPVRHFTFGLDRIVIHGTDQAGAPARIRLLNLRPLGPTFRYPKDGLFRRC
jgi:hypothetical protein